MGSNRSVSHPLISAVVIKIVNQTWIQRNNLVYTAISAPSLYLLLMGSFYRFLLHRMLSFQWLYTSLFMADLKFSIEGDKLINISFIISKIWGPQKGDPRPGSAYDVNVVPLLSFLMSCQNMTILRHDCIYMTSLGLRHSIEGIIWAI